MPKISDKYFATFSPPPKEPRNKYEISNFIAKSPPKHKNRTISKIIPTDDDDLDGGFPIIKASEGSVIVTFGGIQLVSGILMIAFGILTMMNEASMSSVGAGLWGGAMGAANGFVGIIAGFRGCYQSSDRISPLAITVYLALCMVAIGVTNLALVLTATGLMRDSQRVDYFLPLKQEEYKFVHLDESNRTNWAPVLANVGLLIISSVECLTTIGAAFRCYWYVCRCKRRRTSLIKYSRTKNHHYLYDSPDMTTASYCSSSRSKQKLVRRWLGQQSAVHPSRSPVPFAPPYGLVPPYYTIDGKTIYPSSSFVSYSDYNYMLPNMMEPYYPQWHRMPMYPQPQPRSPPPPPPPQSRPQEKDSRNIHSKIRQMEKKYSAANEKLRKKSDSTIVEEDIDKTYTGLDREIAEEFISVAMEPKRH